MDSKQGSKFITCAIDANERAPVRLDRESEDETGKTQPVVGVQSKAFFWLLPFPSLDSGKKLETAGGSKEDSDG